MSEATGSLELNRLPERRFRRKSLREIVEFLVVGVGVLAFGMTAVFFVVSLLTGKTDGTRDFVVYWATGQQLAHHANPYDRTSLLTVERAAGLPGSYPAMFMRNPPWSLPLTLPLGFLSLRAGALLWSGALLACLAAAVRMIWSFSGRPGNRLYWLGYSFAPALICLIFGQTSIFALLGYVLFVRLHCSRPLLAGASLWLCALKPHLFLPFGVVLLAWVVVSKSYRVILGALAAFAVSSALVSWIDGGAWTQYAHMMRTSGVSVEFIPCLSVFLRAWAFPNHLWVQYLPAVLGCGWALLYFWRRRETWDWRTNGGLVMLVSVLAAPYSWLFDQALALPALLQGVFQTRSRKLLGALILASALIEIALIANIWFPSALYLWTLWGAPAWLAWYLAASRPRELSEVTA
jgi:hypothetical protein